jgi:hypothetical protein
MYAILVELAASGGLDVADKATPAGNKPSSTAAPPSSGTAAAAAPAGPELSAGVGSQAREDLVGIDELLPPDFQRHCAAVAVWGPNILTITQLATAGVDTLLAPDMLGPAQQLLSWQASK